MNIKTIIFNGIMNALVFAMIGLAVAKISQREMRTKAIVIGAAALGFGIGAAYQAIHQQRNLEEEE